MVIEIGTAVPVTTDLVEIERAALSADTLGYPARITAGGASIRHVIPKPSA